MKRPCAHGDAVDGLRAFVRGDPKPRCQGDGLERVDRPPPCRPAQVKEEETAETSFTTTVRKVQARAGSVARRWA